MEDEFDFDIQLFEFSWKEKLIALGIIVVVLAILGWGIWLIFK